MPHEACMHQIAELNDHLWEMHIIHLINQFINLMFTLSRWHISRGCIPTKYLFVWSCLSHCWPHDVYWDWLIYFDMERFSVNTNLNVQENFESQSTESLNHHRREQNTKTLDFVLTVSLLFIYFFIFDLLMMVKTTLSNICTEFNGTSNSA